MKLAYTATYYLFRGTFPGDPGRFVVWLKFHYGTVAIPTHHLGSFCCLVDAAKWIPAGASIVDNADANHCDTIAEGTPCLTRN